MELENSTYFFENSSIRNDFENNSYNNIATTTAFFNVKTNTSEDDSNFINDIENKNVKGFWIGVGLSVVSSVFIGGSFIIKKKALIKLSRDGLRANQGGYGYLKDLLWWAGLLSMGVGELANFIAYAFAPASLVSTLGILSVLVTTILSSKYLNEKLNFIGKLGCLLCTIGSTMIVLHAPTDKAIVSMDELQEKITNPIFLIYVNMAIAVSVVLIYHFLPKLSKKSTYTLLIWIGVCSLIGSLSVMSIKGFGLAVTLTLEGDNEMGNWLTWFCVAALVASVGIQMNFLNKALDTFNTAIVTPIYYVMFTTCVIIASAILFREFDAVSVKDWIGLICGFSTVLIAIVLLHCCKHYDITLLELAHQFETSITISLDDHEHESLLENLNSLDDEVPPIFLRDNNQSKTNANSSLRLLNSKNQQLFSYGSSSKAS